MAEAKSKKPGSEGLGYTAFEKVVGAKEDGEPKAGLNPEQGMKGTVLPSQPSKPVSPAKERANG